MQQYGAERGAVSYLGFLAAGFPNLFMMGGPQGPFCNFSPVVERGTEFTTMAIGREEGEGNGAGDGEDNVVVEETTEAEREWMELCDRLCLGSLFRETHS